mmetsp:Transcript_6517/g.9823  ORF Transcript_6517/g.9823 Transcript_6517/m.9823 type:complete len:228 (+) Transcript_6517:122-805(+)
MTQLRRKSKKFRPTMANASIARCWSTTRRARTTRFHSTAKVPCGRFPSSERCSKRSRTFPCASPRRPPRSSSNSSTRLPTSPGRWKYSKSSDGPEKSFRSIRTPASERIPSIRLCSLPAPRAPLSTKFSRGGSKTVFAAFGHQATTRRRAIRWAFARSTTLASLRCGRSTNTTLKRWRWSTLTCTMEMARKKSFKRRRTAFLPRATLDSGSTRGLEKNGKGESTIMW